MIRFLLSVIIITLLITYAVIPAIKYIKSLANKEAKRIDKGLTKTNKEEID